MRRFYRAGVPLLAGTDAVPDAVPDAPVAVPGFALHDELAALVRAGVPAALRAATLEPARYLGAADSLGAVAAGRVAGLALLDGGPLADVANARRVRAVVTDGRLYDRAALDALLAAVERRAVTPPAPPGRRRP